MHRMRILLAVAALLVVAQSASAQPVPSPAAVTFARTDTLSLLSHRVAPSLHPEPRRSPIKRGLVIGAITGAVVGIGAMQSVSVGCQPTLRIRPDGTGEADDCSQLKARLMALSWGASVGTVLGGAAGIVIGGTVRFVRHLRDGGNSRAAETIPQTV